LEKALSVCVYVLVEKESESERQGESERASERERVNE
jgi:hypothetical protein